jgi:hypothetical protein
VKGRGGDVSLNGHGSLVNGLSGTPAGVVPKVGMGLTILMWTDRHAGTITRVSESGKTIWFKRDKAIRVDGNGMSETQEYRFERDEEATEERASLRKGGQWKSTHGDRLALGERTEYHDFSF